MAKNRKKFANQRFIRTIDLTLLRRLLDPHQAALRGLDMAVFDSDPGAARAALYAFFSGPEENHPDGLVTDLHRIAERERHRCLCAGGGRECGRWGGRRDRRA
jgi:hypothetical protein